MKLIARSAAFALAAGTLAVMSGGANAACKQIGAVGTGVTQDIAKFMADAALKNIRENQGYAKASGATTYKCETGMIATDCHARQKVCQ
ncbi:MAG: hypothetical protein JNN24_06455 [Hyphomicrobium zavarzinii]|jgi:hypothetical protein|uniref:hypothetical protein n=1 Tax=Hyphomicrobium zavarzinii TaxID=48292 RepID=UPI001A5424D1|nr:hypothetical protein [Hyphomicrobium zavarzinii]MBL8845396.1 hypothetical protein [Hyphomicrobium zavarzinii]